VLLGAGTIRKVTIKGDDWRDGHVDFVEAEPPQATPDEAAKFIIQNLVGAQAEATFRAQSGGLPRGKQAPERFLNPGGAECDYKRAAAAAIRSGLADNADFPNEEPWTAPCWRTWEAKAAAFNEGHWSAIEAVAEELLRCGTLGGPRVEEIVRAVQGCEPAPPAGPGGP
jgi:hypothetical protein